MKKFVKLILSLAVCQLAGVIGSVFTISSISNWYSTLNKPSFTPPSWLFGPAWITLYFLMGIALFLVWSSSRARDKKRRPLTIFLIQLIVNAFWSIAFFGFKSPLLGLIVIVVLWILILLTIMKFFRISKTAGWLLIPYILWVSFATALNFSIFVLNT